MQLVSDMRLYRLLDIAVTPAGKQLVVLRLVLAEFRVEQQLSAWQHMHQRVMQNR